MSMALSDCSTATEEVAMRLKWIRSTLTLLSNVGDYASNQGQHYRDAMELLSDYVGEQVSLLEDTTTTIIKGGKVLRVPL